MLKSFKIRRALALLPYLLSDIARFRIRTVVLSVISIVLSPAAQISPQQALLSHVRKPWSANVSKKSKRGSKTPVENPASVNSSSFQLIEPSMDSRSNDGGELQSSTVLNLKQNLKIASSEPDYKLSDNCLHKTSDISNECARDGQSTSDISENGIAPKCVGHATDVPVVSQFSPCLDWILNPDKQAIDRKIELQADSPERAYERILSRVVQIEAHESNPHFRDDYQIAWQIVRICQTGEAVECTPQVLATYRVLSCHPDHVWPKLLARRQAMLGQPITFPKLPKSSPKLIPFPQKKEKSA